MSPPLSFPTILVPGFAGGRPSLRPLQNALTKRGLDVLSWPHAPLLYRRPIGTHGMRLAKDLLKLRAVLDQPITIVGWSEGGLVAVSAMMQDVMQTHAHPSDVVRRIVTYGSPFHGAQTARLGWLIDPLIGTSIREMRPSSPTLDEQISFLHHPRDWDFRAIFGTKDLLVSKHQPDLDPAWCHFGPWHHRSPLYDQSLFEVIHRYITLP